MGEMMKKIVKRLTSPKWAFVMMNALAVMAVVQNVNAACMWLDHQPEVPEEAKSFRKF